MAKKSGGIGMVWFLFLFFGIGTFIAISNEEITGAVISGIFSCICLIVIIVHFVLNSGDSKSGTIHEDETERLRKLREDQRQSTLPNYFEVKVTEDLFKEIKKGITSISDFLFYLLANGFYNWLEKHMQIPAETDAYQVTRYMILSDLNTAYLAMNGSIDLRTREGLALFMVTNVLNSNEDIEFSTLKLINNNTIQPAKDLIDGSYNLFNKEHDNNKLAFANIVQNFDKDVKLQYLIVLYRFLSVAAKADNVVTEKESNYLKQLLLQAKDIDTNVTIENDVVSTLDVRMELGGDKVRVGQYIVREQKCVISDIQASLGISRNRILTALKTLEEVGVIRTEGTKRKVLISREGDVIRLLRGQEALGNDKAKENNADNATIITPKVTPNSTETVTTDIQQQSDNQASELLNQLIGLTSVKKEIQTLTNFIKIQQEREKQGLKASSLSYHCVFTGNPGTGKTTVARIVANIYKELGVLKKGHLVETDRAGLVAEYVGQTAIKTNKIIDNALDGVLFIDEAYSLVAGGDSDYGKEAIATLLKRMEDDRDRLVVILAGYTKEIEDFINTNPGLQSRFNRYIEFPDYTAEELYEIFCLNLKKFDYKMTDEAQEAIKQYFADAVAHKDKNFGNGRFVRNVFEKVLEHQANRLAAIPNLTTEQLTEITVEDLPNA